MEKSHYHPIIPETIDGYMSFEECLIEIKNIGQRIFNDTSSTWINDNRIKSMKSLLELFDLYNKEIERAFEYSSDY